jgi:imidazolonepropionase-like amidohydrolase
VATELARSGVEVQVGAHGQREGLAAHWEIWMLAQGGMTPMEALRAATIHGAHYLGLDKDIGSIEPGKLGDVVVLDANPLENIRNTDKVRTVVLNGRVYDGMTLDQLAPDKVKRKAFYWQKEKTASGLSETTP